MKKSKTSKEKELEAQTLIASQEWRLSNLYKIKDKSGCIIDFVPNWAQKELLNPHYLNLILKARQLGITTYVSLLFLDTCLFNDNVHAAIIADNKDTAKEVFIDKVKFAYDHLPDFFKEHCPAYKDNVNELRFGNGSVFRVSTGLRGGTVQLLHITEFAKICVENPAKAEEIMSGALNTLQSGQFACIESTARGKDGEFYEMCKKAMALQESGSSHSALDWKFWFFPWWKEGGYVLKDEEVVVTPEMKQYFDDLASKGIHINKEQQAWYIKKSEVQAEHMKREFPSTPEEAFETSNQGYYFVNQMVAARTENRICNLPADAYAKKFAAWDIGWDDCTAIWVYDIIGKEVHFLDYYENAEENLAHFNKWIMGRPFPIERHFMPHDAANKHPARGKSYADYAREAGLKVDIIPRAANELIDIELVRSLFPRFYFDKIKCAKGLKAIENFRKEWNDKMGCFKSRPFHNWASHGTKALIYAIHSLQRITGSSGLSAEEWARIRSRYT